ncbi:thiosulfate sulfurtransferase [Virgibacillus pantothenticus]|uniref:3-mercaptopyruvate sulfurtransferase n=1 Tax=Virgibacillus pantothenticus TaxID=1473 RepID=A0A0L0QKT5_VIRPA|nr:sulfurtransferase [Virgibacillus pantothenticus]KNE18883.1 3-mercaptopyruvate sulfurtransferase [Virgibacillus pantothenticus]MED3736691.1 sulfurtransferase [Virgibacillus pantothenticus]QTY15310.1 sulfurtransferase [Virgibacillus pantothenticus]SIS82953.1 thiosulfate/3-mercaptopyruvate sulfurtransferase [Virgibacillus pantothenticus]GIP63552.1 thiosulfate sulfurtransferase [Virgibacillus pantothenticus]
MTYVISVERLKNRLKNNLKNTVIIDVRFQLMDPEAGRKAYLQDHIPGAIFMDIEKDLSGKKLKHGGNHPLPDLTMLAAKLGKVGVDHDTTVVLYDDHNDMFAARAWWLLHYMGHNKVYVLDGGYTRWKETGNETTVEIPQLKPKLFHLKMRPNQTANMEEVKEKVKQNAAVLIDSRAKERYLGDHEPMYARAGHIPGAKHYFWKDVLDANGSWKKKEALEKQFASLSKDEEIIVSCGSGISACPNILALKSLGFKNVKLYPGSFSDWISYEDNEVAIGED